MSKSEYKKPTVGFKTFLSDQGTNPYTEDNKSANLRKSFKDGFKNQKNHAFNRTLNRDHSELSVPQEEAKVEILLPGP